MSDWFPAYRFSQASRTRLSPVLSISSSKPPVVFPRKFFFYRFRPSFPDLSGDRGRSLFQSPEEDPRSQNTRSPILRHRYSRSHLSPRTSSRMISFSLPFHDSQHVPTTRNTPPQAIQGVSRIQTRIRRDISRAQASHSVDSLSYKIRNSPLSSRAQTIDIASDVFPSLVSVLSVPVLCLSSTCPAPFVPDRSLSFGRPATPRFELSDEKPERVSTKRPAAQQHRSFEVSDWPACHLVRTRKSHT